MNNSFLAIAPMGREFMYKKKSMISVPDNSADRICQLLNNKKFELQDGEVWHKYENNWVADNCICREIKALRKGKVIIHRRFAL